jgi:hypothetical protein
MQKPLPVQPTGVNMWMTNGERCYARWLPKDHALELKRKEQNCARLFCRHLTARVCVARLALVSRDTPNLFIGNRADAAADNADL